MAQRFVEAPSPRSYTPSSAHPAQRQRERARRTSKANGASRFGASSLHQRDSRSALFEGYAGDQTRRSPASVGSGSGGGYGYTSQNGGLGVEKQGYRPATPNRKGQYSDAVLNELESQNDAQVEGILGKVRVLKDVSCKTTLSLPPPFFSGETSRLGREGREIRR